MISGLPSYDPHRTPKDLVRDKCTFITRCTSLPTKYKFGGHLPCATMYIDQQFILCLLIVCM